jgi:hypothetical protein
MGKTLKEEMTEIDDELDFLEKAIIEVFPALIIRHKDDNLSYEELAAKAIEAAEALLEAWKKYD